MARSDQSVKRAADRIEYAETAARYEYFNLRNGEPADARISLSCDGLLFTAPQALRLLDSVIDLVEEPAGLLLAI